MSEPLSHATAQDGFVSCWDQAHRIAGGHVQDLSPILSTLDSVARGESEPLHLTPHEAAFVSQCIGMFSYMTLAQVALSKDPALAHAVLVEGKVLAGRRISDAG